MAYRLGENVSACRVEDRLVFLSVGTDRYFMLPPETERSLANASSGVTLSAEEIIALENLCERGILAAGEYGSSIALCRSARAEHGLLGEPLPRPSLTGIVRAAMIYLSVRRSLRRQGFQQSLAALPPCARQSSDRCSARVLELASAFAALRLFVDPLDRCLPLSMALTTRARRLGCDVTLVLGVRLKPFAAHAWVQQGAKVLNDDVDAVRTFTPILLS